MKRKSNPDFFKSAEFQLEQLIKEALNTATEKGLIKEYPLPNFTIERPAQPQNGDFSANIALVGTKIYGLAPQKIAEVIENNIILCDSFFKEVRVAHPGFLNFFLSDLFFTELLNTAAYCEEYGNTDTGKAKRVNIEFVSANPTGPMHIGNARGGAMGDSLAALLQMAGFETVREFYINDTGNQIIKFGASLSARYMQIFNDEAVFPEDGYHGEDITLSAQQYAKENGDKLMMADEHTRATELICYALPKNIASIKQALCEYRIEFDVWFSEQSLYSQKAVETILQKLKDVGATYEADGALFFAYTKFGGDKDEVLIRTNGVPTYFAGDIAYHYNKLITRDFALAIDIWGADHHGHIARLKAALIACEIDGERLRVILMQMVRLLSGKEIIKMSKRSGKAITLTTLLCEVPTDAARFFFNMREPGTHLDFDLDLAVQKNSENPVYYVQYAHARICNLIATLKQDGITPDPDTIADAALLCTASERALLMQLGQLPGLIDEAAANLDVSMLPKYLLSLSSGFHKFYTECRIKGVSEELAASRLTLALATKKAIKRLLSVLRVSAPDSM